MSRRGLIIGVPLIVIGLASFGLQIRVLHEPNGNTYGVVRDSPLEALAFSLVLIFAGVVILLGSRR